MRTKRAQKVSKVLKSIICIVLIVMMAITAIVPAFADDIEALYESRYTGILEVSPSENTELEMGMTYNIAIDAVLATTGQTATEPLTSDFDKEWKLGSAKITKGSEVASNPKFVKDYDGTYFLQLVTKKASLSSDVSITIEIPATEIATRITQISYLTFEIPYDNTDIDNIVDTDELVIPIDEDVKVQFSNNVLHCLLDFEGLAQYEAHFGKTTSLTCQYNTDINKYTYHLNEWDDDEYVYFLNFVKAPKFEFESDLYIDSQGCKYIYEIDKSGYATKLSAKKRNGYFVIKDVKTFASSYAITDLRLKEKPGKTNNKGSSSSSSANSKPTTNTGNSSSGGSSSGTGNKPFNSTYGDNTKDKEENLVKKDTLKPDKTVTIDSEIINTALGKTLVGGTATVYINSQSVVDVKALKAAMQKNSSKLIRFVQKQGDQVKYQLILNNRQVQKIKYNTLAVGVNTQAVDTAYIFARFYKNKFYCVRQNNYIGSDAIANFAVKLEGNTLTEMKALEKTIKVYMYDANKNTYTQVANPYFWIDNNGYMHFTVEIGYDYIFSSGVIEKRTDSDEDE